VAKLVAWPLVRKAKCCLLSFSKGSGGKFHGVVPLSKPNKSLPMKYFRT
jgi:hypothetical protein